MSSVSMIGSAKCRSTDSGAHRQARRDRLLEAAERLVEAHQQVAPKRRASGARGADRTAPAVRRPTLSRLSRVARRRCARRRAAAAPAAPPPRRRPRCGRRRTAPPPRRRPASRRGRRGHRNPDGRSRDRQIVQHRLFAAEQMGAAGDVEKQAVGAVERHQRRVAVAPVGEAFEQPAVGLRIGLDDVDAGCMARASAMPMPGFSSAPQPARRELRCAGCCCRDG